MSWHGDAFSSSAWSQSLSQFIWVMTLTYLPILTFLLILTFSLAICVQRLLGLGFGFFWIINTHIVKYMYILILHHQIFIFNMYTLIFQIIVHVLLFFFRKKSNIHTYSVLYVCKIACQRILACKQWVICFYLFFSIYIQPQWHIVYCWSHIL